MSKRAHILEAAMHLFATKGYKQTSTSELARMIGAAESTIFYHFRTKEDILLAILQNMREELLGQFERYHTGHRFRSGLDMLEGTIAFYLNLANTTSEPFMLLHHFFPYEMATGNATGREHLEAIYNCFIDIFEKPVQVGQRDGSIVETSARKTAMILFTMIDGLVRFNTYNLYDAGSLYEELIESCRRMLQANSSGR